MGAGLLPLALTCCILEQRWSSFQAYDPVKWEANSMLCFMCSFPVRVCLYIASTPWTVSFTYCCSFRRAMMRAFRSGIVYQWVFSLSRTWSSLYFFFSFPLQRRKRNLLKLVSPNFQHTYSNFHWLLLKWWVGGH